MSNWSPPDHLRRQKIPKNFRAFQRETSTPTQPGKVRYQGCGEAGEPEAWLPESLHSLNSKWFTKPPNRGTCPNTSVLEIRVCSLRSSTTLTFSNSPPAAAIVVVVKLGSRHKISVYDCRNLLNKPGLPTRRRRGAVHQQSMRRSDCRLLFGWIV